MDNYLEMYINVEGDASRRLELLRKIEGICYQRGWCPFCGDMDYYDGYLHNDDCELAKELEYEVRSL